MIWYGMSGELRPPVVESEWGNTTTQFDPEYHPPLWRMKYDFKWTLRIMFATTVIYNIPPPVTSYTYLRYSLNSGKTWATLTDKIFINVAGSLRTNWINVPTLARTDVLIAPWVGGGVTNLMDSVALMSVLYGD
jgi:hypothetical protein